MTEPTKPEATPTEQPEAKKKPKEEWKQRALDAEAKLTAQNGKEPNVQSPPTTSTEPSAPTHDHKHEDCPTCKKSVGEHFVRQTEPYCPTCNEKNPNFKSLAVCTDCGLGLGTVEQAKTLTGCPNCGGTKAKEFKYK